MSKLFYREQFGRDSSGRRYGMLHKLTSFFVTFFIRALVGGTLIFFINHYVLPDQTSLNVGINAASLVTSGTLGVPGVCLLYSILIFQNL